MFKKLISLVCAFSMLASVSAPVFAAKVTDTKPSILINEGFEDIATNGTSENVNVKVGKDGRAVEISNKNKALYAKAQGTNVQISVPLEQVFDQMVFSFDMMLKGTPVRGEVLKLKSSSSKKTVFTLKDNREILLDDGMHVSGYSEGKWKNYAVGVDLDSNIYNLYIDGELISADRHFYTKSVTPAEITFEFNLADEKGMAEIFLDNIRVYEGYELLDDKYFPKKAFNTEVLDFTPAEEGEIVYDKVFVDSVSKNGLSIGLISKDNAKAEWAAMDGEDIPYVHFKTTAGLDCYGDITSGFDDSIQKYVYQTDIYPVANNTNPIIVTRANGNGGYSNLLYMKGSNLAVDSTVVCSLEYNKWTTVAVAVDLSNEVCHVYVDGNLKKSDVPLPNNGALVPTYFRIGFASGSAGNNEVFFNRIKIYDGLAIREFDDSDVGDVTDADYVMKTAMQKSTSENAADAIEKLGDDIVFMAANDEFYYKKAKHSYEGYGKESYLSDSGKVMTDVEVLSKVLNVEYTKDGNNVIINDKAYPAENKDNALYVEAASVAKGMNKYVYEDNREFVLISNQQRGYKNSIDSHESLEEIDVLWRYLHFDRPTPDKIYDDLINSDKYKEHPRLFVTKDEIPALRAKVSKDPYMRKILMDTIEEVNTWIDGPAIERKMTDDIRMWGSCEAVKNKLSKLATLYILTGDKKYADRAWFELESTLNWPDLNLQKHFLDSGEWGPGIAIAYDVFYDCFTEEQKKFIREQTTRLYLDYCVGVYTGTSAYKALEYRQTQSNWGAVIGTSMLLNALTFMDEEPADSLFTEKCKYLASNALQTLEHISTELAPEGIWIEGMGYWEFVLVHMGWTIKSLDNIFGHTYNFMNVPGLEEYPDYAVNLQTKNGTFNYASTTGRSKNFDAAAFIYADLYNNGKSKLYDELYKLYDINSYSWYYLLFAPDFEGMKADYSVMPRDLYYETSGVGVMRQNVEDPNGLYLASVAGMTTTYGSTHYDKGSFMFEALGETWFVDMGRNGNNTFPYLKRPETHNCLVVNPRPDDIGQEFEVWSKCVRFESKPKGAIMVYDLSNAYGDRVTSYQRGFKLSEERKTLEIRDELTLPRQSDLQFNLLTKAEVTIDADGKGATLKQNGKTLKLEAYANTKDYSLELTDLTPISGWESEEEKNFAMTTRKIRLDTKGSGSVVISVKITPIEDGTVASEPGAETIAEWSIPDGELISKPKLDSISINGSPLAAFAPANTEYKATIPYGSGIPVVSAASSEGTVTITQPTELAGTAVIKVISPYGIENTYNISFEVEELIVNNLIDTKPEHGKPSDVNLLNIASVYASYVPQIQNPAEGAVDGNTETRWSSDEKGSYLEVDLGAVYDLDGIAFMYMEGETRNYIYDILVSEDGMKYDKVFVGQSAGGTSDYEYLKLPVKARYVRYIGYGHKNGSWTSMVEFRPAVRR